MTTLRPPNAVRSTPRLPEKISFRNISHRRLSRRWGAYPGFGARRDLPFHEAMVRWEDEEITFLPPDGHIRGRLEGPTCQKGTSGK